MVNVPRTSQLSQLLEQMHAGDASARERLIAYLADRLRKRAYAMLRHDRLRRWEQSDDLLQHALMRLHQRLDRSGVTSGQELLGLAACEMRRALIDLARHYYRPLGIGANHAGDYRQVSDQPCQCIMASAELPPEEAVLRMERHESLCGAVDSLPVDERAVVDLIWMCGLTQIEAAVVLDVDRKTVMRRWQRARLKMHDALGVDFGEL